MVNILFLCPNKSTSGNYTTIRRISGHLESFGHAVDVEGLDDGINLLRRESSCTYSIIFTIHAYKSTKLLEVLPGHVKVVLIFGGTDLNEHLGVPQDKDRMSEMVKISRRCIAFSHTMRSAAASAWPEDADKVEVIHQGVTVESSETFDLRRYLLSKCSYVVLENIIILVAGIRPVKDPLYLIKDFIESELCRCASFVIVGPIIDEKLGQHFVTQVAELRKCNVIYAGELSLANTHAAIQQSFCLVNSSLSEGMSGAVLEAFDLRVPVLARDIPGNAYLIEHGVTGLLFNSPQVFLQHLRTLLECPDKRELVTASAKAKLSTNFSVTKERARYGKLLDRVL